jgi:hypothetical protein
MGIVPSPGKNFVNSRKIVAHGVVYGGAGRSGGVKSSDDGKVGERE